MTLVLDPPRRRGALRVAVLCERDIATTTWPAGLALRVRKAPAAVLIADADGLRAEDLAGRALDVAVLEAACPGLTEAMTGPEADRA
jgi:hypothetical protein